MIRVFTSCTKSYLPKARVMGKSLKSFHPEWELYLLFADSLPPHFSIENEIFDKIITLDQLDIPNLKQWIFKHSIVELCTAIKGPALKYLLCLPGTEGVFYLDPDICIYNDLGNLRELLDHHDILLTPHLLHPEKDLDLIHGNEIVTTLAHGVFNLGFLGVAPRAEGINFSGWWARRLQNFCYDSVCEGLFTDQRWCDLIPSFFDKYKIIKDTGYNVATWNIKHRPITKSSGVYYAGDVPLRFYHFTGYDGGDNYNVLLKRFAKGYPAAFELWEDYSKAISSNGHFDDNLKTWDFGTYQNNEKIEARHRLIYRTNKSIQKRFPDPFNTASTDSFLNYCKSNMKVVNTENDMDRLRLLQNELDTVYLSKSWKLTKPLRFINRYLKI